MARISLVRVVARVVALAAASSLVACTTLSNSDGARLRDAETILAQQNRGKEPSADSHVAYCQIHCVLLSSGQVADPQGDKLACPPCSEARPNPTPSQASTETAAYKGGT